MLDNRFIDFVNNSFVVKVRDYKDFSIFKKWLEKNNILDELVEKKEQNNFNYWRNLASINYGTWYEPILFEYQYGKGFTFSVDEKASIEWYGKENVILATKL